jgi:exopolyphosphatase/pppGpp-phosphohydrolase
MLNVRFIKEALSFYYELNDSESHGYKHLDDVYDLAIKMKNKLNLDVPDDILMIAVYTHDMFSSINRDLHHELGYKYILDANVYFLNDISYNDRVAIALAVREHRASYKGTYSTILSELLSAADRGIPDIKNTVIRSYKFSKENNPNTSELGLYSLVQLHMKDKFSNSGYARYNSVYIKYFENELTELKNFFDTVSIKDIAKIIEER